MSNGGEQDVFDAALSGGEIPEIETTTAPEPVASEAAAEPAKTEPDPVAEPAKAENEAHVPSWRLREINEEKRQMARELAELRQFKEQQEKARQEAEKAANPPDLWDKPNEFVKEAVNPLLDPVQKAVQEASAQTRAVVEHFSKQGAIKEHGAEKVDAAWKALDAAISSGKLNKDAVIGQLNKSMDPYGDILAWHKRDTFEQEVAGDLDGWKAKQQEALLKDPEFLAKALAAARGQAAPVTTTQTVRPGNVTPLPSLNATPRAGDEGDEPEDPADVFNAALNSRQRRA
jgi:hypothetical protein